MIQLPLCVFNRHAPHRSRVRWDGLNYVGTCRWCDARIRRHNRSKWARELGEDLD